MDLKAESFGVGCFDRNDDWIVSYLEAGRNCGFHIFPFLRVNLIHFQSLEYSIVIIEPKVYIWVYPKHPSKQSFHSQGFAVGHVRPYRCNPIRIQPSPL